MSSNTPNAGKGAIFDLDGTLLDSLGVWDDVDEIFFSRRGIDVPDDYQQAVSPMAFPDIADYTIRRFNLNETPQAIMQEWNDLAFEEYTTKVRLKPGARDYLEHLHATGAKLGVASTLMPSLRDPTLAHLGVDGLFDAVCGIEEVGGLNKDHPDLYMLVADRMGVEPGECTVFEDIVIGVRTAKRIGMKALAMLDDSSRSQWEGLAAAADGTLRDFTTAPQIL
ncbi:HAD family hydrolase [Pseudoscardovia suis]|uniref:Beta-phosphoglucomutase n=1 Tax=Pseudoscardovia suis TaxID=987063 RepID=A0A261EYV2_9BIFI|nr:HAD family phosphatase [Pseudoscardovia suis]OZG52027.1 beta-phosphoglucomutase [Pseudoscardovia suis]PJJ69376.1 HAD superfamily hydrolase (TIGR01509 family) [Pseudoscardovia suis]